MRFRPFSGFFVIYILYYLHLYFYANIHCKVLVSVSVSVSLSETKGVPLTDTLYLFLENYGKF